MPRKFDNVFVLPDGRSVRVTGEFPDNEWQALVRFVSRADRLRESPLVQEDMRQISELLIAIPSGEGLTTRELERLPLNDLAMSLRPFVLDNDATFFFKILNYLSHRIEDDDVREWFKRLRREFQGLELQKDFEVMCGSVNVTSYEFLKQWLTAKVYHVAPDLEDEVDKTLAAVDPQVMRHCMGLMMGLIAACVSFVYDLILALRDGTPVTIWRGPIGQATIEWTPDAPPPARTSQT